MSTERKLSWIRISAGVALPIVALVVIWYGWQKVGNPSQALRAYRKAKEFMEALRAKDERAVCRLFSERERPRCVGLVARWFEWGELPPVNSYTFRSIEALGSDGEYFDYSVKFAVSPLWRGDGLTLVLYGDHQGVVVSHFYPPATGF